MSIVSICEEHTCPQHVSVENAASVEARECGDILTSEIFKRIISGRLACESNSEG